MEFLYNVQLERLERSKQYKQMISLYSETLYQQWEEVLFSGLINKVSEKIKKQHLKKKYARVQKQVNEEVIVPEGYTITEKEALLAYIVSLIKESFIPLIKNKTLIQQLPQLYIYFANKGGQQVLDQISDITGTRPKVFSLQNPKHLAQIEDRIDVLLRSMDEVTIKSIASSVIDTFASHTSKTQANTQLTKKGKKSSEERAKTITATEVVLMYEFIRNEAARKNGIQTKTWITAGDDRVCPKCSPNNFVTVKVEDTFPTGFSAPPVHPKCRCTMSFGISKDDLGLTVFVSPVAKKSTDASLDFYEPVDDIPPAKIVNPEAIWAGGEGLIGKDRKVSYFAQELQWNQVARRSVVRNNSGYSRIDAYIVREDNPVITTKTEQTLIEARRELSDVGYLQLLRSKGFSGKVVALQGIPAYPEYPFTDIVRRYAQDQVRDRERADGTISVTETYNFSVHPAPKTTTTSQKKTIPTSDIDFSKDILSVKRIISIMENFTESQKRGGDGISVVYIPETKRYIVTTDGNHRLFAAKMLGLQTVDVQVLARE